MLCIDGGFVRRLVFILAVLAVLALTPPLAAAGPSSSPPNPQSSVVSPDPELDRLRVDYARRFFSADAHLRLAKYFADHGQPLIGFHISEEARRDHFGEDDFLRAVRSVYRNEPPAETAATRPEAGVDPAAESLAAWRARAAEISYQDVATATATIEEALAEFPQDGELHFRKAELLHDQKKYAEAAASYELAASLGPWSAYIQGWTARFFLKGLGDRDRALRYYLATYFLAPNFHETEYVDERIRTIISERASTELARRLKAKVPLADMLDDPDPVLVRLALEAAAMPQRDGLQRATVLLAHDDPTVRYAAAHLLGRHLSRRSHRWLEHALTVKPPPLAGVEWTPGRQLYVRSAAAYVAGAKFRYYVVPMIEPWLDDPFQLMQYDAVSVLAGYGGATGMHRLKKLRESGKVKGGRMELLLDGLFERSKK